MRKNAHGSHGGAWKVAYADFVTAMMALFLVLWLTSQDEKIKEAVQRSFRNPFTSLTKESTGLISTKDSQAARDSKAESEFASMAELNMLRRLNQDLKTSLESNTEDATENTFKFDLKSDGLRISIFDRARRAVFEPGSAKFTPYGNWVFSTLAWQLGRESQKFLIELEGHTESGFKPLNESYGAWEMSADRGNTARRALEKYGLKPEQVRKVSGYADTDPIEGVSPDHESNRRVTVMLKLRSGPTGK